MQFESTASTIIWFVIGATFVASFFARGKALLLSLSIEAIALAMMSGLLIALVGSIVHPIFRSDQGSIATSERIFVAIWWLLAARLVLLIGRIGFNKRKKASRLVFDLVSGAIHLGVILTILNLAFGVSVTSLVATSGVIAIVLGLALQSTLGDLFSGIAISVEQPFETGDYVWLEGSIEGVVIETNWRATRIVTDNSDIATVPNSVVAKARILNRSRPTEIRSDVIRIVLDSSVEPQRGIELLEAALASTKGLPTNAPGQAICSELKGEGTTYQISFSAPRRKLGSARSDLLQSVARHARFAGIAFAMQNGAALRPIDRPDGYQLLCAIDLFRGLPDSVRQALAPDLVERRGKAGEVLFGQGESIGSLFIIREGVFEVGPEARDGSRPSTVIGPGDHVGELSLTSGAVNPASVKASTAFLVYEVTKESLARAMRDDPSMLQAIEAGAARSQEETDRIPVSTDRSASPEPPHLVDRIKSFFDLPA